ncbi:MAG TPA: pectate lyase, partial [Chryseosolibacter sp.]|nr:pectate lyase [Chryseosolibacter sp.]
FHVEAIRMQSPRDCFKSVLATAGASFRRDAVDRRIVKEVRAGDSSSGKDRNGIIDSQTDVGGWPALKSLGPPADKDGDGMPDAWEKAHSLNTADAADACKKNISKEYDNIEVYLNGLVKGVINGE